MHSTAVLPDEVYYFDEELPVIKVRGRTIVWGNFYSSSSTMYIRTYVCMYMEQ